MAKKVTSKRAATSASKVLRDKRTSKSSKTAAGSALSQRETGVGRKGESKQLARPYKPIKPIQVTSQ